MQFDTFLSDAPWLIREDAFNPNDANFIETIMTVGNGYLGTRAALEEGHQGALSATYLAGVYDNHDSTVIDLVNAPDWTDMAVYVDGGRLDMDRCKAVFHIRALDMRCGFLMRETVFEDPDGRQTRVESLRFASMHDRQMCGIRLRVTPLNYSGDIIVESGVNGHRRNLDRLPVFTKGTQFDPQVKWDKWAKSRHLETVTTKADSDTLYLEMKTIDTGHHLAYAASLTTDADEAKAWAKQDAERVSHSLQAHGQEGETLTFDKIVSIATSRDQNVGSTADLKTRCRDRLTSNASFDALVAASSSAWIKLWDACDVSIDGDADATRATRFNLYHLLICGNPDDPYVNIGAKSLSGEGYKGHVFWDTELFMLPFYIYTQPETAKALLLYRYHTLDGARENARINGFKGAQYPWESADTGLETTPKWTADGQNRIWTGEEEIHVSSDVAHGILTYVRATGDEDFLLDYGLEILIETCRFWASRLEYNDAEDRYELTRVIGPDEFHEHVDNNTFTNYLTRWQLETTVAELARTSGNAPDRVATLRQNLALTDEEVEAWQTLSEKIHIPIDTSKDLIEQYDGYFDALDVPVTEFDVNNMPRYPEGYDHFNAGETQLVKQPDVVMLLYILPDAFSQKTKAVNFAYYEPRTLHKSSLSPAIHAIMGIEVGDTEKAQLYFNRSAFVDLANNQGNTQDGIHIASAGGTWQALVFGFGGFRVRAGQMSFAPWLPENWDTLKFRLNWRGDMVTVSVTRSSICFETDDQAQTITLRVFDREHTLNPGRALTVSY